VGLASPVPEDTVFGVTSLAVRPTADRDDALPIHVGERILFPNLILDLDQGDEVRRQAPDHRVATLYDRHDDDQLTALRLVSSFTVEAHRPTHFSKAARRTTSIKALCMN
jgi:hypothetical protein